MKNISIEESPLCVTPPQKVYPNKVKIPVLSVERQQHLQNNSFSIKNESESDLIQFALGPFCCHLVSQRKRRVLLLVCSNSCEESFCFHHSQMILVVANCSEMDTINRCASYYSMLCGDVLNHKFPVTTLGQVLRLPPKNI